jgi:hypothetical protein
MAFQSADPAPFIPACYEIQGRELMVRAFAKRNLQQNNDVAIVTISPLPQQQVPFTELRDDIVQFLAEHKRIAFQSVQLYHLGQAYVRFNSCLDRDALVHGSPHNWLDLNFTFVNHDAAESTGRWNSTMIAG